MPSLPEVKILQISKLSFVGGGCCIALKYIYQNKYNKKFLSVQVRKTGKNYFVASAQLNSKLWNVWFKMDIQLSHCPIRSVNSAVQCRIQPEWRALINSQIRVHQWWFRVLSKHILLKLRRGFIGNGSRWYTWFYFFRFCGYFGGVSRSVKV